MIRKGLILKIFDGANMQRWNDKMRPVELTELDKQAHKMIIAYLLGKFEEKTEGFSWTDVIEGGIFELFQRLVLTDLKPQIFYKIKAQEQQYEKLKQWVYNRLRPLITPLGRDFRERYQNYFSSNQDSLSKRILGAAHFYTSAWEFDIIERMNPNDYEIADIRRGIEAEQMKYCDLKGMRELTSNSNLKNFVELCGELRFQLRWSHIPRVTKTSVLGHMLIVAILSYLFSLEIKACSRRCFNNYFTGLFHDLPEVLTRDIISPIKRSVEGIADIVKEYEREQMRDKIYSLIPSEWHGEIKMFTENEFQNVVTVNGKKLTPSLTDINKNFNENVYNPRDGELVEAFDDLAAFTEAYIALRNGVTAEQFQEAKHMLKDKYRNKIIAGKNFGEIYADFE